ncbi:hypothetical protein BD626DRAFT_517783 [Schizophyllum amplum]|uniref:Uncharacterized protein n=1 Tax=Schizophyllum amplum TaxID=97359 RepID=A0A550BW84_9AGAR|nr:hypothetical protein BD626DRAFT_517783 [Auriculariopsis ampla]
MRVYGKERMIRARPTAPRVNDCLARDRLPRADNRLVRVDHRRRVDPRRRGPRGRDTSTRLRCKGKGGGSRSFRSLRDTHVLLRLTPCDDGGEYAAHDLGSCTPLNRPEIKCLLEPHENLRRSVRGSVRAGARCALRELRAWRTWKTAMNRGEELTSGAPRFAR